MERKTINLLLALKLENDGLSKEGGESAVLGLKVEEALLAMLGKTDDVLADGSRGAEVDRVVVSAEPAAEVAGEVGKIMAVKILQDWP